MHRRALELSIVRTDSKGQRQHVWMVPAPFCAMQYISDPRYLPEDESRTVTWGVKPRKANVNFKAAAGKSREDDRKQQGLQAITLRNSRVGLELFGACGRKYWIK